MQQNVNTNNSSQDYLQNNQGTQSFSTLKRDMHKYNDLSLQNEYKNATNIVQQSINNIDFGRFKQNLSVQHQTQSNFKQQLPYSIKDQIIINAARKNGMISQGAMNSMQSSISQDYMQQNQRQGNSIDYLQKRRQTYVQQDAKIPNTQQYIKRNIGQYVAQNRGSSLQVDADLIKQNYQEMIRRFQKNLNSIQYGKLFNYLTSQSFQRILLDRQHDRKAIQNTIKDIMGITLQESDVNTILQYTILSKESNDYGFSSSQKMQKNDTLRLLTRSVQDLPQLNTQNLQQQFGVDEANERSRFFSPHSKSKFSEISKSTSFSRPFTSISFVSSTTIGTSLTQKIERLNKTTLKSIAKNIIQCKNQIEQSLKVNNLNLKSMLTIGEIVMYLQNTDVNLTLTQLQNVLVGILLIQYAKSDMLLSFKTILKSCQNYIDQSDVEKKDFFNRSKGEKLFDDIRDYIYLKHSDLRQVYMRATETDIDQFDKTVMSQDHFLKYVKSIVGDKYSTREIEMIYRNMVSTKPLSFTRFAKLFSSKPVEEVWFNIGIKNIKDYILRKRLTSIDSFERFLTICGQKESGKLNKLQFREVLKRENLPFSFVQIDFLFNKFDKSQDGYVDSKKWCFIIQDDHLNPLQILREVIERYELTGEDLLQRMDKRLMDPPLNQQQFKDCLMKLDNSLTSLQLKSLFELLKNSDESKVEIQQLIINLTGEQIDTVNFKKEMTKKISDFIVKNEKIGFLRDSFEKLDATHNGLISTAQLLTVLIQLKLPFQQIELEKFIRHLKKDNRNMINYQNLLNQFENTKDNFPLKSIGMRLQVFLKQNHLTPRTLLDKLILTKNSSNKNKHQSKQIKYVSISFFAKFIKAKVDKKKGIEEIKELIRLIDLDKDSKIGESDLEAFLGRINFQEFFENKTAFSSPDKLIQNKMTPYSESKLMSRSQNSYAPYSTSSAAKTMTFISSSVDENSQNQLFPREQLNGDKLVQVLNKVKEDMKTKNVNVVEAFKILDKNLAGLLSFGIFSRQIDQITQISQVLKEKLFAKMDTLNIGLVSFDQFMDLMNKSAVKLREENLNVINDSFEWEQNIVKEIQDWIRSKNYSITDAFKMIDQDFDGIISQMDLKSFLLQVLKIKSEEIHPTRLQRLYKILDLSKQEKIMQSDFESIFATFQRNNSSTFSDQFSGNGIRSQSYKSRFSLKNQTGSLPEIKEENNQVFDWQAGCIFQIGTYISKKYANLQDSFESIASHSADQDSMIKFADFMNFINKDNVLHGFNLTQQLYQRLFAAMDPHKKGYLTIADWKLLYQNFNTVGGNLLDIQGTFASSFIDCEEAYKYIKSVSKKQDPNSNGELTFIGFNKVVQQLLGGRLSNDQVQQVWNMIQSKATYKNSLNSSDFNLHFGGLLQYRGETQYQDMLTKQLNRTQQMTRSLSFASPTQTFSQKTKFNNLDNLLRQSQSQLKQKIDEAGLNINHNNQSSNANTRQFFNFSGSGAPSGLDPLLQTQLQNNFTLDKLRRNLKTMSIQNIKDVCDCDNSGKTSSIEFKNAMKKLGINSKEIDRLMEILIYNQEGMIDLNLLQSRLQRIDGEEELLDKRNNKRIVELKRMMNEQMTSPEDAFRYFDKESKGRLTYQDFQNLIQKLYDLLKQEPPSYPIMKDMFDQIDIRKDGIIDFTEWTKTFINTGLSHGQLLNQSSTSQLLLGNYNNSSQQKQQSPTLSNFFTQNTSQLLGDKQLLQNINNSNWITSKDYSQFITLVAKNRKQLDKLFSENLNIENLLPIQLGLQLFKQFVKDHFLSNSGSNNTKTNQLTNIEDWKIEQIVGPFQELKHGEMVLNYSKMLDTIRDRQRNIGSFPKHI